MTAPSTSHALAVWVAGSETSVNNLQFGLETQTWGFKVDEPDYHQPATWLLMGRNYNASNVRTTEAEWAKGACDVILCELTALGYVATAPHMPDEVASGNILYPVRIGFRPVAVLKQVPLSKTGPLGNAAEALRTAAVHNKGVRVPFAAGTVTALAGLPLTSGGVVNLAATPGLLDPAVVAGGKGGGGRQGYAVDPLLRTAVEDHSVKLAKVHMEKLGWPDVEELGKPYDLVCRKPSGDEKHVEVKGTTGAGAQVLYTPNEVDHFRDCPLGADLIVVRDIKVDRSVKPYATSGGELLHIQNYKAPEIDLQATEWSGRVQGW